MAHLLQQLSGAQNILPWGSLARHNSRDSPSTLLSTSSPGRLPALHPQSLTNLLLGVHSPFLGCNGEDARLAPPCV